MDLRILILPFLLLNTASAQIIETNYFSAPVKIPVLLSANFGELRANHFHSGIDIKTQGTTGLPVYAAADGEISRLNVSPTGYGLALYLDHPNGTTTVYGHLQKFRDDIQAFVRSVQYEKESFALDIPVSSGKFPVKKGELIAYSGNSGSSGGPHLHFEIRDQATQKPQNPLLSWFHIHDDKAPVIQAVMLYPLSDQAHVSGKTYPQRAEVVLENGIYRLKGNPVLNVYGDIGFGVQTFDYITGSGNKCGVYEIDLAVDGESVYRFRMGQLNFDETRYLNSHIDYAQYQKYRRLIHKTWVEPGNRLKNYPLLHRRGRVNLSDEEKHQVSYRLKDVNGNESRLDFEVISKPFPVEPVAETGLPVRYDHSFAIREDGIEADFSSGSFYSDFHFDYQKKVSDSACYSPLFQLHHNEIPVHQAYNLRIKAVGLPDRLAGKALIAAVDPKTFKKWAIGGTFSNGWIETNLRQLGTFAITVDTIPPTITPLNIQNKNTLTNQNKISFKIRDNFAGIDAYRGELDGKWALFEYDAKNALLEYYFDSARAELGKNHQFKLTVTDAKGNASVYKAAFYR